MNKKFLISWVVIFIAWMAGGFVVHVLLLGADYASAMPNLMRPEADQQAMFHWMLLARIITAGAFVWIYDRGNETKPWVQQGIRFGIAVALLAIVPVYLIYYVIQPISGMLVVKQILFDGALMVILGVIVAFLNKPQAAASGSNRSSKVPGWRPSMVNLPASTGACEAREWRRARPDGSRV